MPCNSKLNILVGSRDEKHFGTVSWWRTKTENQQDAMFWIFESRYHVYERAKRQYKEMVRRSEEGIQPLFISKNWNREERHRTKNEKKKNWFKKNRNYEAVMFVPTTPDEKLAKELQMCLDQRFIFWLISSHYIRTRFLMVIILNFL